MTTTTKQFFHNLIEGEFSTITVVDDDVKITRNVQEIRAALPERKDDYFIEGYAEAVLYTQVLRFNKESWEQVPPEYKTFQTWWDKRTAGTHEAACYQYFVENVPRDLVLTWRRAVRDALTPWVPPHEANDEESEAQNENLDNAEFSTETT